MSFVLKLIKINTIHSNIVSETLLYNLPWNIFPYLWEFSSKILWKYPKHMEFINSCRIDQYHMVSKLCGIGQYHMFCKPHMFFTIFHWKTSWRFSKTWRIDQYHMFCKTCGIGQYHMFDEKSCFTMGYIVKSHKLYRNADPIQFKKLDWKIYNSSLE